MPQTMTTIYPPFPTAAVNVKEDISEYQPKESKTIKNPHDKYFKETFGDVSIAKDFLYHYLPEPLLQATDLNTLEPQKDSFINNKLEENYSDLLFKANIHGQTSYFYFLFEHKSYDSKNIVLQLLKYMTEIWNTKANKKHDWELPLIIPLVIYHGPGRWNSPRSLGKMIVGYDLLPKSLQIYLPDFEYIFYDLTTYSDEEIRGSAQLKAYLTICRDILTGDGEQFLYSLLKAIDYLSMIKDEETRRAYFQLLMNYIFQAGKNLSEKDTEEIINKIPEGSEIVMTLAEIYQNKGRKESTIEIAKKLVLKGLDTKDIIEVTELTKKEVEDLQKEMEQ